MVSGHLIFADFRMIRNKVAAMKDLHPHSIDLESAKLAYLQDVVAAHGLPDIGKAVRCLINYARENPDKRDEIFSEVRCLDC